jgi:NAD(P)-dependent dehydrogenase (short-subunit alcohol dehydrogenase family)
MPDCEPWPNVSFYPGRKLCTPTRRSPIYKNKAFAYDATRAALNAFTVHQCAAELRNTPIKVNFVRPGRVKTELGGAGANLEIA